MAQGAKGRSRQADPSGQSTNQTRPERVKGTGGIALAASTRRGEFRLRAGYATSAGSGRRTIAKRCSKVRDESWRQTDDAKRRMACDGSGWGRFPTGRGFMHRARREADKERVDEDQRRSVCRRTRVPQRRRAASRPRPVHLSARVRRPAASAELHPKAGLPAAAGQVETRGYARAKPARAGTMKAGRGCPTRPAFRRECGRGGGLSDRRGVQDAAVIPQFVQPARDRKLRVRADVAVEHFAVIADRPNGVGPPSRWIRPSGLPKSPSVPTSRFTAGFCDCSASSIVFETRLAPRRRSARSSPT